MNRDEADASGESEPLRRAVESDIVIARNDDPRDSIETGQLRVLCIGMAGLIAADALVLIFFWTI